MQQFKDQGFEVIDLPAAPSELLSSFSSLPFDEYMGKNRYRRFSQYKLEHLNGDWQFEKLPSRPYLTFSKYNKVAGGFKRHYEPIVADFTSYIRPGLKSIGLNTNESWQINVHQYRVLVTNELEGITVPEGIHCDGHDFVMILVFKRHNISGAQMRLYRDIDGKEEIYSGVVQENQAALLNDRTMFHYVTPIEPIPGEVEGYRDIVVVAISKWSERWYGDEFDQQALEPEQTTT